MPHSPTLSLEAPPPKLDAPPLLLKLFLLTAAPIVPCVVSYAPIDPEPVVGVEKRLAVPPKAEAGRRGAAGVPDMETGMVTALKRASNVRCWC